MAKVKVAVIVSTTRAARFGHKPAQWIAAIASQRDDMVVEVLDLREYPMPFFDEVASNAWVPSQNEVAQRAGVAASKRCRAAAMAERFFRAHRPRLLTGSSNECPSFVNA